MVGTTFSPPNHPNNFRPLQPPQTTLPPPFRRGPQCFSDFCLWLQGGSHTLIHLRLISTSVLSWLALDNKFVELIPFLLIQYHRHPSQSFHSSGRQSKAMNTPPKIIGILGHHTRKGRFKYAQTGDKVTVAIRGQVKWGYIVGCKIVQRPMIPKFDSNNVILVEKNGTPMGKRVFAPVPSMLRKRADGEFSKVLAICSKFYWTFWSVRRRSRDCYLWFQPLLLVSSWNRACGILLPLPPLSIYVLF